MSQPVTDESIQGLLIEGVDYSGKTVVTSAVAERLVQRGHSVYLRACFVHLHPIIERLLALAKTMDDMASRDVCYTAALLLDLTLPPLPRPSGYQLQERHALTQIGRNTFFYDDDTRWEVETIWRLKRRFSCQVFLWSDLGTKRARTRSREPKSPRDALLASDANLHQRYDDHARSILPRDEPWLVIDTSGLAVGDVADRVVAYLDEVEHASLHAVRAGGTNHGRA